jgi:hypothetical protein
MRRFIDRAVGKGAESGRGRKCENGNALPAVFAALDNANNTRTPAPIIHAAAAEHDNANNTRGQPRLAASAMIPEELQLGAQ